MNVAALNGDLKSYADLKAAQDAAPKPVAKPEEISWALPKDLDPADPNTVYELNVEDPLVKQFAPLLTGLPQEKISALVTGMARYQLGLRAEARDRILAEEKKLGDKAAERINGAQAFVEKALITSGMKKEDAAAKALTFRNTWWTAEQIEIVETLAKYSAGPRPAGAGDVAGGVGAGEATTFKERAEKMYPPDKDPFKAGN